MRLQGKHLMCVLSGHIDHHQVFFQIRNGACC